MPNARYHLLFVMFMRVRASTVRNQFFNRKTNIPGDLSQQWRGNVTTFVQGNGRATAIGVAILSMRTALAHQREAEGVKEATNIGWFEKRNGTHVQPRQRFACP